jgi:hypothetical protein
LLHDPITTPRALRRAVSYARAEESAAHAQLTASQRRVKVATENRVALEQQLAAAEGRIAA